MPETKTYTGGCHCGAVRFEVETDLSGVVECNCSHCSKKGFLLAFVPADKFRLIAGQDAVTEYRFNKKQIAHQFCPICGVQAFASGKMPDGSGIRSVNVRCLDGVELGALEIKQVDGRSF